MGPEPRHGPVPGVRAGRSGTGRPGPGAGGRGAGGPGRRGEVRGPRGERRTGAASPGGGA
ncbi:hypothetical protein DEJ44_17345 [Streptomyces venezuelae]|nr:hypothetical protein DEJ44_17345 [Streptomyces venezuelae]